MTGYSLVHSTLADGNFSYRYGTQAEVENSRVKFLAKQGLSLQDCVALHLSHSDAVSVVTKSDLGRGMKSLESGALADAMITQDLEIALFLLTADCLPVVIYDPGARALALAHVSKVNTPSRFLPRIISQMGDLYSSAPARLTVYLGPCIHRENFNFDLIGINTKQLLESGINPDNITASPVDTYTSPIYFSHRRSVILGEPEGRFATLVKLK